MDKILIISNSHDLHVDLLEPIFKGKNTSFFRLNLDCFPRDYYVDLTILNGKLHGNITDVPNKKSIKLTQIKSVWVRKPADYRFLDDNLSEQELAFANQETEHVIFSLLYALDCFWMNHPKNLRASMWKGEQLLTASQIGFKTPNTLITNNPHRVLDFNSKYSPLIYKTMSSPILMSNNNENELQPSSISTTILEGDMLEDLSSVNLVPCQFQPYINKDYEIRVTIIGDQVFAAKIYSQEDERTVVDCRDMSADITYQAIKLPSDIEQKCLSLLRHYQLNYSAIDLIVTPEGDYVFLEHNPSGQFLYIDQLIPEYNLLETVADVLIKAKTC